LRAERKTATFLFDLLVAQQRNALSIPLRSSQHRTQNTRIQPRQIAATSIRYLLKRPRIAFQYSREILGRNTEYVDLRTTADVHPLVTREDIQQR
jgi:hypothetical protein